MFFVKTVPYHSGDVGLPTRFVGWNDNIVIRSTEKEKRASWQNLSVWSLLRAARTGAPHAFVDRIGNDGTERGGRVAAMRTGRGDGRCKIPKRIHSAGECTMRALFRGAAAAATNSPPPTRLRRRPAESSRSELDFFFFCTHRSHLFGQARFSPNGGTLLADRFLIRTHTSPPGLPRDKPPPSQRVKQHQSPRRADDMRCSWPPDGSGGCACCARARWPINASPMPTTTTHKQVAPPPICPSATTPSLLRHRQGRRPLTL